MLGRWLGDPTASRGAAGGGTLAGDHRLSPKVLASKAWTASSGRYQSESKGLDHSPDIHNATSQCRDELATIVLKLPSGPVQSLL